MAKARPAAKSLEFTANGAARLDEQQARFRGMLEPLANQYGQRRGAQEVDNTDVDAAYRELMNPRPRPPIVDVAAEIGLVAAGTMLGYATSLLSEGPKGPSIAVFLCGAFVAGLCAILKHVSF